MYKFRDIKKYIKKVETRLNNVVTKATGHSPNQVFLKTNILDILKKDNYFEILRKAQKLQILTNKKYLCLMNKNRKQFSFTPGSKVMVKNRIAGKMEPKYIGPCIILQVSLKGNSLCVSWKKKRMWVNIKGVKPV